MYKWATNWPKGKMVTNCHETGNLTIYGNLEFNVWKWLLSSIFQLNDIFYYTILTNVLEHLTIPKGTLITEHLKYIDINMELVSPL